MEKQVKQKQTSSTELSDDFDVIVNEINDFIAILEERGQQREEEEKAAKQQAVCPTPGDNKPEGEAEEGGVLTGESEDSTPFVSPRNTIIRVEVDKQETHEDEPIYEEFQDVKENAYEAINVTRTHVTATATANLIPQAKKPEPPPPLSKKPEPPPPLNKKPEIKPKPKFIKMVEPNQQQPKRVKALHNFKGTNNDELCFSKGDIVTVTQTMEGGWWEGTLNGKTGWFPSNYTKEVKGELMGVLRHSVTPKGAAEVPVFKRESMPYYHNVVLQNVIDTEKTHVQEMTMVLQTYIQPIQGSSILTPTEYLQLVGNLEEIVAFQNNFLNSLEECAKCTPHQRRVGGAFMKHAPRLKELYLAYCANHPRAVAILQNKREELSKFMESIGATNAAMALTTNLYKPFTRLDKYPSLLKELERHVEESHVDRGDTQRAIAVYRDIANACMDVRKLKEMEYEILTSAIKGWEGEEMTKLGEVVHLSHVQVETLAGDKCDRIFVLFPSVLVMLSMSPRLSGYQYEGSLPLSGMTVCLCEDESENQESHSFEISGNMIEEIIVTCGTTTEATSWVEALKQQVSLSLTSGTTKPQSLQISTSQPSISQLTQAKTAKMTHSTWSTSCLRPSPPLRQHLICKEEVIRSPRMGRKPVRRKPVRTHSQDEYDYKCKWRQYDPRTMEEDAVILKVIEAYCTSAKTRHTVNSSLAKEKFSLVRPLPNPNLSPINESTQDGTAPAIPKESINVVKPMLPDASPGVRRDVGTQALLTSPHVLIAEEEKIIVDEGDPSTIQEKTLVDTVYSLRDQVKNLEQEQKKMKRELDEETKARKRLETKFHKALKNRTDLPWDENMT
ncbi:rho guanine nucleotide exchange factor 7-like isoform X3 [Pecten maximus]|uniref:rho guanine nucleotide exchange factor 7-like isoform X3 n=1 Tax=Pecten maximus TaxID=6579 RepID=UPI001457FF2D|nr:rho guanine nucleotide exchange factor 7-like isoform X3 [Pecten maximus]